MPLVPRPAGHRFHQHAQAADAARSAQDARGHAHAQVMAAIAQRKVRYGAENEISLLAAIHFVHYEGQFPPDIAKRYGGRARKRSWAGAR